jgi:predicted transglutaminase-like cysteine proteinase
MFGRVAAWWGAVCVAALLVCMPARSALERDIQTPADIVADAVSAAREPVEPAPDMSAGMEMPFPPAARLPEAAPFGLATTPMNDGDVAGKWKAVTARIASDNEILARCRTGALPCPAAAEKFLAIVRQGRAATDRARIGVINRAINLAIAPMSDLAQWGVADRWSPPLETFATGHGDCEDYAIAKYVALTAAGVAPEDVKLVIVRNIALDEDHAVVAVRLNGDWAMLDNRWLTLVADNAMRQVTPLFVLDDDGVRKFAPPVVPPLLAGTGAEPAPASL